MSLLEKPSPTKTAQQLFAEGLFEVGISIESYPPLVISHWDNPTITAAVEKIQQQLQRALGIRVELALLDWKDYMRKLGSGEYQVQSLAWYSWYDDPLYNLEYLKYKDNGLNGTGWERAEYISLLNHANSAVTPSVRQNYLRQAEAFVMDEIPVIPIFYQTSTYAMSRQLGGEVFPSTGTLELKWLARCRDGNNLS
jgi:oligopeptide transport system substrate-binding protein